MKSFTPLTTQKYNSQNSFTIDVEDDGDSTCGTYSACSTDGSYEPDTN